MLPTPELLLPGGPVKEDSREGPLNELSRVKVPVKLAAAVVVVVLVVVVTAALPEAGVAKRGPFPELRSWVGLDDCGVAGCLLEDTVGIVEGVGGGGGGGA